MPAPGPRAEERGGARPGSTSVAVDRRGDEQRGEAHGRHAPPPAAGTPRRSPRESASMKILRI